MSKADSLYLPFRRSQHVIGVELADNILLLLNTARAFTGSPIPLRFAREVGSIMSHYAELKGEDAESQSHRIGFICKG